MRELTEAEAREEYDARLNKGSIIKLGALTYPRSVVLKEVDPFVYREGLLKWADSEGIEIVLRNDPTDLEKEIWRVLQLVRKAARSDYLGFTEAADQKIEEAAKILRGILPANSEVNPTKKH